MKTVRLLTIVIYLLNHERVSAKELAEKCEVSLRTIQRDINVLVYAGVPIISYAGMEGGYEIMSTYKMQVQLADKNDYALITTALRGLNSALSSSTVERTLDKIETLNNKEESNIILDFSVVKEQDIITDHLRVLNSLLEEEAVVEFEYTNVKGESSKKIIEPVKLVYKWYSWYLIGYDNTKKEYRYYKLIRMENIVKGHGFNTHSKIPMKELQDSNFMKEEREYYTITVLCKQNSKIKSIEYLNGKVIETRSDGDYILQLYLPKDEEIWKGVLISFGNEIQIIGPQEVKKELEKRCNQFLQHNYDS